MTAFMLKSPKRTTASEATQVRFPRTQYHAPFTTLDLLGTMNQWGVSLFSMGVLRETMRCNKLARPVNEFRQSFAKLYSFRVWRNMPASLRLVDLPAS